MSSTVLSAELRQKLHQALNQLASIVVGKQG